MKGFLFPVCGPIHQPSRILSFLIFIYLFIWLCQVSVAAHRIYFSCSMWSPQLWHTGCQLWHVGSSSLTRDGTRAPCIGSVKSQLLDHQGSLQQNLSVFLFFQRVYKTGVCLCSHSILQKPLKVLITFQQKYLLEFFCQWPTLYSVYICILRAQALRKYILNE